MAAVTVRVGIATRRILAPLALSGVDIGLLVVFASGCRPLVRRRLGNCKQFIAWLNFCSAFSPYDSPVFFAFCTAFLAAAARFCPLLGAAAAFSAARVGRSSPWNKERLTHLKQRTIPFQQRWCVPSGWFDASFECTEKLLPHRTWSNDQGTSTRAAFCSYRSWPSARDPISKKPPV